MATTAGTARRTTTARDRRRAERERRQRAADVDRPLRAWWEHYTLELGARDVRPGTVTTYRVVFDKLVTFVEATHGPQATADDVTPDCVELWREHMHRVEGLKPQTVNQKLRHAGTFFNWLAAEGVIPESPTLSVAYVPLRREDALTEPKVLSARDVRALIAAAQRGGDHGGRISV